MEYTHPIDELLREYSWNRKRFAEATAISVNTLATYHERKKSIDSIPAKVIYQLAEVLNVSTDEVFKKLYHLERMMSGFRINAAGAKIYHDPNLHEMLEMKALSTPREKGSVYDVLSVGVSSSNLVPLVTIKEGNEAVAYRLPAELSGWAFLALQLAEEGGKAFPAKVEFGMLDGQVYAEILQRLMTEKYEKNGGQRMNVKVDLDVEVLLVIGADKNGQLVKPYVNRPNRMSDQDLEMEGRLIHADMKKKGLVGELQFIFIARTEEQIHEVMPHTNIIKERVFKG